MYHYFRRMWVIVCNGMVLGVELPHPRVFWEDSFQYIVYRLYLQVTVMQKKTKLF